MGFKYREINAGGGRARILGDSIPKYCSYCGMKLEIKVGLSNRYDRNTGKVIAIAAFDCPMAGKTGTSIHERFYLDDPVHVIKINRENKWEDYLNNDAKS